MSDRSEDAPSPQAADAALAQRIFMLTTDPTVMFNSTPMPAATVMLYRVCGNDVEKFHEATRLIELFIRQALATGRQV